MLTPQQIEKQEFGTKGFGKKYNAEDVDDFLDEVYKDYSALYKENAVLKSKMKVLVDKIEEYRSVDDAMRKALLAAQTMAEDMVSNAKKQSEEKYNAGKIEAERRIEQYREKTEEERLKYNQAKKETNKFISDFLAELQSEVDKFKSMQSEYSGDTPSKDLNMKAEIEANVYKNYQENINNEATINISEVAESMKNEAEEDAKSLEWHDETTENGMFTSSTTLSDKNDVLEFLKNIGNKNSFLKDLEQNEVEENNSAKVYNIELNDNASVSIQEPEKKMPSNEKSLEKKFDHLKFGKNYDTDER